MFGYAKEALSFTMCLLICIHFRNGNLDIGRPKKNSSYIRVKCFYKRDFGYLFATASVNILKHVI